MSAFTLEKEPFRQAGGDEFYFSTPALTARLEELRGAIDGGHVLLIDEEASGKSTMLDRFVETADRQWRIFRLQGRPRMSARDFVDELVSSFGLPTREPAAAELRDADTLLEMLGSRSRTAVIVIDEAHRLENSALEQLVYLARRWERYSVRFLICAAPCLMDRLEALNEGNRIPGVVTTLDMPRFDSEQVSDYLHICLFRAGLAGNSPFDPALVASVTEKARGLVGAVDPIARTLLNEARVEKRGGVRGGGAQVALRRWPVAVVAAVGLGALLLTVAVPGTSTSSKEVQYPGHAGVFRSSITLAPGEGAGNRRLQSAAADPPGR